MFNMQSPQSSSFIWGQ